MKIISKNILCLISALAISVGVLSSSYAMAAPEKKTVPGGLSSKKGSGKILPPNAKLLKIARA